MHRQVLRPGGGVRRQTEVDSGLLHPRGRRQLSTPYLHLARGHRQRADDAVHAVFPQEVQDQVALRAVLDGKIQAELLGDADGRHDVVRPVAVDAALPLAPDDGDQLLQREVALRPLFGIRLPRPKLLGVVQRLIERPAQDGGQAHARHGSSLLLDAVDPFGVLPQRELHVLRAGDGDVEDRRPPSGLEADAGASDDVGRPGAGVAGGEAGAPGLLDGHVKGIQGVDAAHLGRHRVGLLVSVDLGGQGVGLVKGRDVRVGVDQPRRQPLPRQVQDLRPGRDRDVHTAGRDLSVLHQDRAALERPPRNRDDPRVFQDKHLQKNLQTIRIFLRDDCTTKSRRRAVRLHGRPSPPALTTEHQGLEASVLHRVTRRIQKG